jgi:hypothetical protein
MALRKNEKIDGGFFLLLLFFFFFVRENFLAGSDQSGFVGHSSSFGAT